MRKKGQLLEETHPRPFQHTHIFHAKKRSAHKAVVYGVTLFEVDVTQHRKSDKCNHRRHSDHFSW